MEKEQNQNTENTISEEIKSDDESLEMDSQNIEKEDENADSLRILAENLTHRIN